MNIQEITWLLLQYKYLIMFFLMFLEWPIISFISAFLAAKWIFEFWIVYILSVAGDTFWDILRYRVGRFARNLWISPDKIQKIQSKRNIISKTIFKTSKPITKRLSEQIQKIEKKKILKYLEKNVKKRFFISLLIVKITPPLSIPGQFSFGFLKISFWKYLLQTIFVCFLFESVFLNLWYFSSISMNVFKLKFDNVASIITSTFLWLVALLIWFLIIKRFRNLHKRIK